MKNLHRNGNGAMLSETSPSSQALLTFQVAQSGVGLTIRQSFQGFALMFFGIFVLFSLALLVGGALRIVVGLFAPADAMAAFDAAFWRFGSFVWKFCVVALAALFVYAIFAAPARASNTPCSKAKKGIARCDGARFVCNDGSTSTSRKNCLTYMRAPKPDATGAPEKRESPEITDRAGRDRPAPRP